MARAVALLRGVNLGGRNRLAMGELRALAEELGLCEVETFIQSGNLLFSTERPDASSELETAIERRFGLAVTVVVRSAAELERVCALNPFPMPSALRFTLASWRLPSRAAPGTRSSRSASCSTASCSASVRRTSVFPAGWAARSSPATSIGGSGAV